MGVFGAVVEVPVLAVLHTREDLPLRGAVAFQLVGDEHPWHVRQSLQPFAEEPLGRVLIPPTLHENVKDVSVLIDRPPEIMSRPLDGAEHFVQVPLVAGSRAPPAELIGLRLPELQTPLPDGFVRDNDSPGKQQLFHIAIAEAKPEIEPYSVANDFRWKPVVLVGRG